MPVFYSFGTEMFHTYREGSKEGSTDLLLEEIHFPYWAVR